MERYKRATVPSVSRHGGQQICRLFNQPGGCQYGPNCKFLHVSHTVGVSQSDNVTAQNRSLENSRSTGNTAQGDRDGFQKWRYSIPLDRNRAQPLGPRMPSFLLTALQLIDSDTGVMQQVITSLTSEGGFMRIKEILDRNFDLISDKNRRQLISSEIIPLFKIITHADVVASIMLEEKFSSIYNFLYGRQGDRGIGVFTLMFNAFTCTENSDLRHINILEPVLAVFSNMIDMNTHALSNDGLSTLAELLFDISNNVDNATTMRLCRYVTKIRRRLGLGHLLELGGDRARPPRLNAAFLLPQDGPGSLSPNGPRHDNDHTDIKKIQILPTSAEIRALRPPYLPPSDPAQLYLPGVQGLLDRHFRLLGEDAVGQLRDTIKAEIDQGITSTKNKTRIHTYNQLVVMRPSFSRWKGLQLMVRVNQPQQLRQSILSVRKEWWDHTNRLRPDAVVCIIGQDQSVTFCTVSGLSHSQDSKSNSMGPDRDNSLNMYSDKNHCYLKWQPVKSDLTTVSTISKVYGIEQPNQRLVEFPGVLLPSFLPTLEALQRMSERHDLPFAEILAPEGNTAALSHLNPPLYAAQPNFQFELKDIMRQILNEILKFA